MLLPGDLLRSKDLSASEVVQMQCQDVRARFKRPARRACGFFGQRCIDAVVGYDVIARTFFLIGGFETPNVAIKLHIERQQLHSIFW